MEREKVTREIDERCLREAVILISGACLEDDANPVGGDHPIGS